MNTNSQLQLPRIAECIQSIYRLTELQIDQLKGFLLLVLKMKSIFKTINSTGWLLGSYKAIFEGC
jgi:hypothetical protein